MPKDDQNKNSKKGKRLTEDTFAETPQEQILKTEYSELMQKSYIDYAMSVRLRHERDRRESAPGCPGRTKTRTEKNSLRHA